MLFHSTLFGLFFLATFALYWLLHRWRTPRLVLLLAASYLFYAGWSYKFTLLIALTTVVDYFIGRALDATERPRARRLLLGLSLLVNLGILGTFKYYDFFIASAVAALEYAGFSAHAPTLRLILPAGISFYTFQSLSYVIDVYRRQIRATSSLLEYATYIAFFPQLVAGPIVRAGVMLPQLARLPELVSEDVRSGLYLVFRGLLKKVLIADVLAETLVDQAFANVGAASGAHLLLGVYGYAFQVYGDFSGYSDVAIGAARMLGIELPINFDLPYRATSVRDFWRRWHVSLSTWLRDYVYFPLGGNRGGKWQTCRNLFATMVLAGLWHGAAWNFVIFGVYHGLVLCGEFLWRSKFPLERDRELSWWGSAWRVAVTFHVLCAGFIIFRLNGVSDMVLAWRRILTWAAATDSEVYVRERGLWILGLACLLHFLPRRWLDQSGEWLTERCPPVVQGGLAVVVLGVLGVVYSTQHPFIYFQF